MLVGVVTRQYGGSLESTRVGGAIRTRGPARVRRAGGPSRIPRRNSPVRSGGCRGRPFWLQSTSHDCYTRTLFVDVGRHSVQPSSVFQLASAVSVRPVRLQGAAAG